jgi:molecular chaperone GrpE
VTERRPDQEHEGLVIRDKRRIDPETGKVRETPPAPDGVGPAPATAQDQQPAEEAEVTKLKSELKSQLEERTSDLQRLQAEYSNYRKRVERDRVAVREQAVASALAELLPVLDDIGRAQDHGELTGGFKSVADALESVVGKLGLTRFGEKGEPFDPTVHEALMHSYSPDVAEPTCVDVLQPGYRIGDRVIRPARVAVAEPAAGADAEPGPASEMVRAIPPLGLPGPSERFG